MTKTKKNALSHDIIAEALLDDLKYIETFLLVKTKESETVRFKLTPIQRRVAETQARRNIFLKPRQVGMSTYHLARRFARVCTRINWTAVTIAHDIRTTELLFQRVQFFYNNLPDEIRPKTKYNNKRELFFPELNSRYIIFTAGNENGVGRGETVNDVHGSEISRWDNPEDVTDGLMESAPKDAYVDLESTAYGAGGYFHTEYNNAKDGRNNYKPFFFEWWWQPEYQLTAAEASDYNVDVSETFSDEELTLISKHKITIEQVYWRRWKITALKSRFQQEYPEDDATCFLTTSNLYFDRQDLTRAKKASERLILETRENESIKIWKRPDPTHEYVIGADAAEGLQNGDFDAASILDYQTGEEVATLHGRWPPHEFAYRLAQIGEEYNNATLAVERNNHGHAVLAVLIHQIAYRKIYRHKDYDAKGRAVRRFGWPTTSKTKPIALNNLEQALRDAPNTFADSAFFNESFTFIRHDDGSIGAVKGCHDDRIMARAIAQEVLRSCKPNRSYKVVNLFGEPIEDESEETLVG